MNVLAAYVKDRLLSVLHLYLEKSQDPYQCFRLVIQHLLSDFFSPVDQLLLCAWLMLFHLEPFDLVNCVIIFLYQTSLLRSLTVTLTVLLFWIYLFLDASICSTAAFSPLLNSDHVLVSVFLDFLFPSQTGMVFMIIWGM